MLPADNRFIQVMKLLFCMNLVFSYPLTIVPTFDTIESICMGKKETGREEGDATDTESESLQNSQVYAMSDVNTLNNSNQVDQQASAQPQQESNCQYWMINVMRSSVVLITVIIVVLVADKLDRVMSIAGAIFGMINVLLLPAIAHLKLTAKTTCQKVQDVLIMIFAVFMLVFGPLTIVLQWQNSSE